MLYHYRCSHKQNGTGSLKDPCGARRTLRKPIEEYVRRPRCPACKRDSLRLDPEVSRRHAREVCRCEGLPYPHRRKTKWCIHYTGLYSEDEYRDMIHNLQFGYTGIKK